MISRTGAPWEPHTAHCKRWMPDLLHVDPASDDAMLDGIFQGQDAPPALDLIAHIGILLIHAHQHALVLGVPTMKGKMALGATSCHP